jgi:hypothetical protein
VSDRDTILTSFFLLELFWHVVVNCISVSLFIRNLMDSQRLHKGSSSCTSIVWLVIFLNHDYNDCLGLNFVKMLLTKLTLKCYLFQVLYGKEPLIGRDENERETTSPVSVTIFFYRKWERERERRQRKRLRNMWVYENEQIRTNIQQKRTVAGCT